MNSKQSNKFALTVQSQCLISQVVQVSLVLFLPLLGLVLLLPLLRHRHVCLFSPLLVSCCALEEGCLGECMADLLHLQLVLPVVVAALEIVTCDRELVIKGISRIMKSYRR